MLATGPKFDWTRDNKIFGQYEWLTYVYNLVEICDYADSKDRIIRDVLIVGCNSDKAKDRKENQAE